MLVLEVRKMFQVWLAALGATLFLVVLVVAAFWLEGRRGRPEGKGRVDHLRRPYVRPKAA
jgi:uncharacterized protein YggT (Ycf19 family)